MDGHLTHRQSVYQLMGDLCMKGPSKENYSVGQWEVAGIHNLSLVSLECKWENTEIFSLLVSEI